MKLGELRNGFEILPKNKRKNVLLLADDLRMSSGIGTMSKEIVLGTTHQYNWVQIAGAIKHPDTGKRVSISKKVIEETGVPDAEVLLYPVHGYGDQELVRYIINEHNIDFILHYTDPRFWGWLYQMEHEIRQQIPIFYYAIWDDIPHPMYNQTFYASCDLIMGISKQSHTIHRTVLQDYGINVHDISEDAPGDQLIDDNPLTRIAYVPHGIDENKFYPIDETHAEWNEMQKFRKELVSDDINFIVFFNSRNIRRKMIGDLVLAFKVFCDQLSKEDAKKCALVLHTTPVDENGTDLPAVVAAICPEYNIVFSHNKLEPKYLNYLYNVADITANIASNEGFGLGTAESLMAGTPIIVNVTGGMQDQCGFKKDDGSLITINDVTKEWATNHDGRYKTCGEWVKPVFPSTRSLVGSVPTPYIMDDRANWEDVAIKILEWYKTPADERTRCGLAGHKFILDSVTGMSASDMSRRFMLYQNQTLQNWKSPKRFKLYKCNDYEPVFKTSGISNTKDIKENTLGY